MWILKQCWRAVKKWREKLQKRRNLAFKGNFVNRSNGENILCIVLAGYKEFLFPSVFGRLKKYMMEGIDVCVVSSGLYSSKLEKMCDENRWSYISVKRNNVMLAQNVAIHLHPQAKYIFKLDEDIFITEHYFANMMKAYEHAKEGDYTPGVLAPLININGYGHMRILEKLELKQIYKEKFEVPKYMAGRQRMIEWNPAVAKFFWGGVAFN